MENNEQKWKERFARERSARKDAERLLEEKSLELYNLNQSLQERIENEIAKNKERESFLAEQSKLASMGEMIGNIAHQWRQPLSAITSTASGAKLQLELDLLTKEESQKSYSTIIEKSNFLSDTIEDFRNFFKSNKEKVEFNLIDVVKNVESIVAASYRSNNIDLVQDLSIAKIIYTGLPGELSQVILNLFNNARDILVEKEIDEKMVMLNILESDDSIVLKIFDSGGGVPEDIIGKIFEPYFTTKHQAQGTGIGLYMCREILRNHFGGQIYVKNKSFEIEAKEYFGACFIVEIKKDML